MIPQGGLNGSLNYLISMKMICAQWNHSALDCEAQSVKMTCTVISVYVVDIGLWLIFEDEKITIVTWTFGNVHSLASVTFT